jgi:hypothetical protein
METVLLVISLIGVLIALTGVVHNYGDENNQHYFIFFVFILGFDLCVFIFTLIDMLKA